MARIDRYRHPSDLPSRVPLFPLRGAILLPRATLPLNVFEPRYLAMLDDVLSGQRIIGIVQPATAEDAGESPESKDVPLRKIGCAGRVTAYQEQDDGRVLITLTGIARFEIVGEAQTPSPYRVATAAFETFASDFDIGHGEDQVDRVNLIRVLRAYLEQNRLKADWTAIERAPSEYLINALCIMSPYGSEEKQALLEAENLQRRAEVLIALAEMELASTGGPGGTLQ